MSLPSNYECEGQMSIDDWLNPDSWCGKTCLERSVQTKERTSDVFLKKQRKSQIKMPLFLDLRMGNGHPREQSWVMGGLLHGEYMMHSFGECPSVENASRLSQILEANPHPKYYLSAKACQGILNRAERRGKTLPPILKEALIQQVIRSKSGGGVERDSSGKKAGKGPLIQTELSATLGVSQDQTLICLEDEKFTYGLDLYNQTTTGNVSKTLNAVRSDSDHVPCVAYGLDRASFNQGQNAKFDFSVDEEISPAIVAKGPGGVMQELSDCGEQIMNEPCNWDESQIAPTLTARNAGGNQRMPDKDNFQAVIEQKEKIYVVRRLTPMECERLQGYPDGWTNIGDWTDEIGKVHKDSDTSKYKALGNSLALPFWAWMAERMIAVLKRDGVENPTMASLFDGIGGFPLVYSRCGCKPIWASEIEEFPIAVTKRRFPDGDEKNEERSGEHHPTEKAE